VVTHACVVACALASAPLNPFGTALHRSSSPPSPGQERREREPNSVTPNAAPRSREVDGPIILWSYTGREESAQPTFFHQEDGFYYLNRHHEEGAGLIFLPAAKNGPRTITGPAARDVCSPAEESRQGKMERRSNVPFDRGFRRGPASLPASFSEMRATVRAGESVSNFVHRSLPYEKEKRWLPATKGRS